MHCKIKTVEREARKTAVHDHVSHYHGLILSCHEL